ncbi:MAG: CdaR family protein [Balneolaceae bacterium]|jgi:YbbR domain-containing protein
MEISKFEQFKENFFAFWDNLLKKSDEEAIAGVGRERIVVFIVSFILALCLWLMVNLSRDYNLNVELPIRLGSVPQDKALVDKLPKMATVSVTGEGWKLINLYNNPPGINVDVRDTEVNLFDQVQQQMNAMPDISVQKVQPLILTLKLEDRLSKRVPVRSRVNLTFKGQYGLVGSENLQPDSITVSGASSLINGINDWPTDSVQFQDVSNNMSRVVKLKAPGELIDLSRNEVIYNAHVEQFTEGEAKVNIETRNLPEGRSVSFSPTAVTVKFDIPISEYTDIKNTHPFRAFVRYTEIEEDSTGFVTPQIEQVADDFHIKMRTSQPRRVAYFIVLKK